MTSMQLPGMAPPKNGLFYTISELKEQGTDVSNHLGEKKTKKKSTSTTTSPRLSPSESIDTITEEEPKISKTRKKPATSTSKRKVNVSEKDTVYWVTKGRRKVLIHNGVQKSGAVAFQIYQKYKELNPKTPSPSSKKKTSKRKEKEIETIDDEDENYSPPKKQKVIKNKRETKKSSNEIENENQQKIEEFMKKNPTNSIFKKKPVNNPVVIELDSE